MKYSFSLDESDYLTHQLFIAASSKQSLNRRRRSWLLVTGSFVVLAFVFLNKGDTGIGTNFIIAGVFSFIFYPFFIRWKYKRHFEKHIKEHLSNNFGQKMNFEIGEDQFITRDEENSESKISFSLTKSMHELPKHFLIRLDNGQSLILPKEKVPDLDRLRSDLVSLAQKLNLMIVDNTKWNWNKSW